MMSTSLALHPNPQSFTMENHMLAISGESEKDGN